MVFICLLLLSTISHTFIIIFWWSWFFCSVVECDRNRHGRTDCRRYGEDGRRNETGRRTLTSGKRIVEEAKCERKSTESRFDERKSGTEGNEFSNFPWNMIQPFHPTRYASVHSSVQVIQVSKGPKLICRLKQQVERDRNATQSRIPTISIMRLIMYFFNFSRNNINFLGHLKRDAGHLCRYFQDFSLTSGGSFWCAALLFQSYKE